MPKSQQPSNSPAASLKKPGEALDDISAPDPARPLNVALLVVDDLRADHVSAYGYSRRTTPNLDARFTRGSLFKNCISPTGWTLTACASILTGHLADAHGLTDHNQRFQRPKLGNFLGE